MDLADLYDQYQDTLHRYARQFVPDAQSADDLVQETFIRAMGHFELLKLLKPYQRRAWLFRTLKNLFRDQYNAQKRRESLLDQLKQTDAVSEEPPAMMPDPFELVPDSYQELFEKRYRLGMTSNEIAQELGIPAATVRSRLHYGMKQLRAQKSKLQ